MPVFTASNVLVSKSVPEFAERCRFLSGAFFLHDVGYIVFVELMDLINAASQREQYNNYCSCACAEYQIEPFAKRTPNKALNFA